MMFRRRYVALSKSSCRAWVFGVGMTSSMCRCRSQSRTQAALYPLSPAPWSGQRCRPARRGLWARSMTGSKPCVSCVWPAVTPTARTMPWLSQTRWTLVLNPPRDRPSAWSAGSCSCAASGPPSCGGLSGFFPRPGGRDVGPVDGAVEAPQVALDDAGLVQLEQQGVEDVGPGAVFAPAVEAVVDGLPGAVAARRIRPGGAGVQVPEDAVDERPVVVPRVAAAAVVVAVGEEAPDALPLGVGEVKAVVHGWPPSGNRPSRELGSPKGKGATPMPYFSETT